jgi:hypothetical protein
MDGMSPFTSAVDAQIGRSGPLGDRFRLLRPREFGGGPGVVV